jgi:glycerophosphoryl diester phosphodiesterase
MRKAIDSMSAPLPFAYSDSHVSPSIVGHRGAPAWVPENTLDSFLAAASAGAAWVELDARRCQDATLAVHHDPCAQDGVPLVALDAASLAKRGVWTLSEVLARLPFRLGVDVEVKNLLGEPDYDDAQRIVGLLAEILGPFVGRRPLMTSSFNPLTVQALAGSLAGVPAGLIHGPGIQVDAASELARQVGARVLCSHSNAKPLDMQTVAMVHEAGLQIMVWVVNDPVEAVRLARIGVDALCTDDPGRLVTTLRDHGPRPRR